MCDPDDYRLGPRIGGKFIPDDLSGDGGAETIEISNLRDQRLEHLHILGLQTFKIGEGKTNKTAATLGKYGPVVPPG